MLSVFNFHWVCFRRTLTYDTSCAINVVENKLSSALDAQNALGAEMAFLYPRQSREWDALFVGSGESGGWADLTHDSQESGRLSLSDLVSQADEPTLPTTVKRAGGSLCQIWQVRRTSLLCPWTTVKRAGASLCRIWRVGRTSLLCPQTTVNEQSKMATALTPQTDVTSEKVTWLMENPRQQSRPAYRK